MMLRLQSPRERAARALARLCENPEDDILEGQPIWKGYLEEVDTVLKAALGEEHWMRMRALDEEE